MKVVMLGRQAVGKSALVDRFANDRWSPDLSSTIGGSFCAKEVVLPQGFTPANAASASNSSSSSRAQAGIAVTLGLWDTAGSERYEALTRHYFTQAEAAFVCFDLTDIASWEKVDYWIKELKKVEPTCRIYILGCKADLIQQNQPTSGRKSAVSHSKRCVAKEIIAQYCQSQQPEPAQYFETSALTGAGIQLAFQTACYDWSTKPKKPAPRQNTVSLDDRHDAKKKQTPVCCNQ